MVRAIAVACFALIAATSAAGQIDFADAVRYPVNDRPAGGATVDLDADGDLDLDFVVVLFGSDAVQIATGDGAGSFTLGATFDVGSEPSMIAAADFDDDGFLDVAVNDRASADVAVLINDGAGGFEDADFYDVGAETRAVAVGNLTNDGLPDLAVSSRDDRLVRLFESAGDGTFTTLVDLSFGSILEPQGVAIVDLDGDDALDVVAASAGTKPGQHHASVFLQNNGGHHWVGPINGATNGLAPTGIAAADFDLDGIPDVATSNEDSDDVSVLKNGGIGIFFSGVTFAVGPDPEVPLLLAGDLDGNSTPDLVALDAGGASFSVLLNATPPPWVDRDHALAGTNGLPALHGIGTLLPDSAVTLTLSNALASAPAFLFIGLDEIDLPFRGGVLVPSVDLLLAIPTDVGGGWTLDGTWSAGIPAGEDFFLQVWIVDAGATKGLSASNALQAVAH